MTSHAEAYIRGTASEPFQAGIVVVSDRGYVLWGAAPGSRELTVRGHPAFLTTVTNSSGPHGSPGTTLTLLWAEREQSPTSRVVLELRSAPDVSVDELLAVAAGLQEE
jgi:hypothetical protein